MENKEIKIKYVDVIEDNKKYHFWYGGDVVEIKYDDNTLVFVAANGDMIGDIYNKEGEVVEHFKDKRNGGVFYSIASKYFKNDEELMHAIFYHDPDKKEIEELGLEYYVHFDYSNCWEIIPCYKGEIDEDGCFFADGYSLDEAIKEALNNIDEIIDYIKCD